MTRHALIAACALACLGACGQTTEEPPPDPAAAAQVGEAAPLDNALPPVTQAPRYVGLWATTAETCNDPAWTIRANSMSTQGEVSCDFHEVDEIPGGYEIQAMCTAEAPPAPYRMQFTFAESAQAMMITGGPWSPDPGLVHCAPLPTQ